MIESVVTVIEHVERRDCDASGYAHHAAIIAWTEVGRVAILRENGMTVELAESYGYHIATGKINAEFKSPIKPDDTVVMHTTVLHLNSYKIKTLHRIYVDHGEVHSDQYSQTECAEIAVTSIFIDSDFKPKQLPAEAWDGNWDENKDRQDHDYDGTVGA